MVINVTSIGISYLDPAQLPEMLKKLELYIGFPYDDGINIPTIGIGIALQQKDKAGNKTVLKGNVALVLRKIGVFSASDATAPVGETSEQKDLRYQNIVNAFSQIIQDNPLTGKNTQSETDLRNALNAKVAQYITDRPDPQFELSLDQAKEVKIEYILGYAIGPFSDAGAQAKLDLKLDGLLAPAGQPVPHDTREYKALMSLYFNGPSLVGPKLLTALATGDRAEAWFEIRYNSNAGAENVRAGTAKRRYWESEVFGLYDSTPAVSTPEARQVYRMFTLHRDEIKTYEKLYGIAFDDSLGTKLINGLPPLLAANSEFSLTGADAVDSIRSALSAARDALLAEQRVINPSLQALDLSDDAGYWAVNIFLDPGRDLSSQTLDPNHAGVLNARELVNGVEQTINNILIGEGGDDILIGGKGDDVLIGGEGLDTYRFVSGDGTDTILDDGGNGVLIREGNPLGFGVKTPEGQWSFEGTTFTQNGTELELTFSGSSDTITLKDFDFAAAQAGDYLGIRLRDTPSPADRTTGTAGSDGLFYNLQNTFPVTFEGLEGADVLQGGPSDDALFGKSEAQFSTLDSEPPSSAQGDFLTGERGADLLAGSAAVDVLSGGPGSDRLYGGPGDDLIYGDFGIVGDFSSSTGPQWQIVRGANPFQVSVSGSFLAANDPVALGGADVIDAGAGNDAVFAGGGNDLVLGGAGDDVIGGDDGDDILLGEAGNDQLAGDRPDAYIDIVTGLQHLDIGVDLLDGGDGNDQLYGVRGDDMLFGGAGADVLYGDQSPSGFAAVPLAEHGNDYLDGEDGNDTLFGDGGADTLIGGAGSDSLQGGPGKDTYVFNRGDAVDVIFETPAGANDPEASLIVLGPGIERSEVKFTSAFGSLLLDLGAGDAIELRGWNFLDPLSSPILDRVEFADGSMTTYQEVLDQGFDIDGTEGFDFIFGTGAMDRIRGFGGNDVLRAAGGDDTLTGGGGNDTLEGGAGNDTYVFNPGDGADRVLDDSGELDTLILGAGIAPQDVRLAYFPTSAVARELAIDIGAAGRLTVGNASGVVIERYQFADGTLLTHEDMAALQGGLSEPLALLGGPADDVLIGATGNDWLEAFGGNDTLLGNTGDDRLQGGAGEDVYEFAPGDGHDIVTDTGGTDRIQFGAGLAPESLTLSIRSPFRVGGFGASYGRQYELSYGGENDAITLAGELSDIELLRFADGRALTVNQLAASQPTIAFSGDEFNNNLDGIGFAAVFEGGPFFDLIYGGTGDDVYRFARGDNYDIILDLGGANAVEFGPGISPAEVSFDFQNYGDYTPPFSILIDGGFENSMGVWRGEDGVIGTFRFADGTEMSFEELATRQAIDLTPLPFEDQTIFQPIGFLILGGAGNDTIEDSDEGEVTYLAGPGDDFLRIFQGNNYHYFFNLGDGADTIQADDGSNETLYFGAGIAPESVTFTVNAFNDVLLGYGDRGDSVFIVNGAGFLQIERFKFADGRVFTSAQLRDFAGTPPAPGQAPGILSLTQGHDVFSANAGASLAFASGYGEIRGLGGDDTISAIDGNAHTLVGGAGNDQLFGGAGEDTYVFNPDDGVDRIGDAGGVDTLAFGSGVTAGMLTLGLGSLVIRVGAGGDAIHIDGFDPADAAGSGAIERFTFADGTNLTHGQLIARGFDLAGTDGDDTVSGTSVTDRIDGLAGNDTLIGGAGSDTYVFGRGSGQDIIEDLDAAALDSDTVRVGADVAPADIAVTRAGDFITLAINGTSDQLSIRWQPQAGYQIERVEFADGTVWDAATLESMAAGGANTAPTLANAVADQTAPEDATFSFTLPAGTFVDADAGDTLTLSAVLANGAALPGWLSFDTATHTLSGTPTNEDVGSFEVRVTATDGGGLFASDDFALTVVNTNDAPVLSQPLADLTTTEREAFSFVVPAVTFVDVDAGDALSYAAELASGAPLPSWLAFNPLTRTFSGTPGEDDIGTFAIQVTATDQAGAQAADEFNLSVALLPGVTLTGTSGQDTLVGGAGADTISGLAGADELYGNEGQDLLNGGDGADELFGGTGNDTLYGGAGADTMFGDEGTDTLYGELGADTLWGGVGKDTLYGGDGADTLRGEAGEDLLYGDIGADALYGGTENDYLSAGLGGDQLSGEDGNDVMQGGDGADSLIGGAGNDLLQAQLGGDTLDGEGGNDFLAAGGGGDTIKPGAGQDVIAFNRGDGSDTVQATGGPEDTVSVGGGVRYQDLTLSKSNNNLVLDAGSGDRLTFKDWYAAVPVRPALNLQVIAEAMVDFDPASSDPLLNRKVQTFDFQGIYGAFEAARAANPALTSWALTNALLDFHLSGSDTEALGGDLAYQYGKNGALTGIALNAAQDIVGAAQFGAQAQALRPLASLQDGLVKLS